MKMTHEEAKKLTTLLETEVKRESDQAVAPSTVDFSEAYNVPQEQVDQLLSGLRSSSIARPLQRRRPLIALVILAATLFVLVAIGVTVLLRAPAPPQTPVPPAPPTVIRPQ